jgi:hypothetical protein
MMLDKTITRYLVPWRSLGIDPDELGGSAWRVSKLLVFSPPALWGNCAQSRRFCRVDGKRRRLLLVWYVQWHHL